MSDKPEIYARHLAEVANGTPLRLAMNRLHSDAVTIEDLFAIIEWELWECIFNLPPMSAPANGATSSTDACHASACACRVRVMVEQIRKKLDAASERDERVAAAALRASAEDIAKEAFARARTIEPIDGARVRDAEWLAVNKGDALRALRTMREGFQESYATLLEQRNMLITAHHATEARMRTAALEGCISAVAPVARVLTDAMVVEAMAAAMFEANRCDRPYPDAPEWPPDNHEQWRMFARALLTGGEVAEQYDSAGIAVARALGVAPGGVVKRAPIDMHGGNEGATCPECGSLRFPAAGKTSGCGVCEAQAEVTP